MTTMTAEARINKNQIKLIHTVKSALLKAGKITDDEYRLRIQNIHGFSSTSKDLSQSEADQLFKQLEAMAIDAGVWKSHSFVNAKVQMKYSELEDRPGMATPSQLRLIEAHWADVTRYPFGRERDRALRSMCWRICKVDGLPFLRRIDVHKMINAIKSMQHKRGV